MSTASTTPTPELDPNPRHADDENLTRMLGRQVADRPDDVAVVDGARTLTFAQLWNDGTDLARRLTAAGVGPERIVGLYLDPAAELIIATWATLLAGAAYLPLAPDYPEDRLAYMVEDSGLDVVVTQPHLREALRRAMPPTVDVIVVDAPAEPRPAAPAQRGQTVGSAAGTDLAYVIYTSGTTGRPKGVAIEQRAIASQIRWLRDEMGVAAGEVVLRKTPISFDAAQWETLAVAAGARVVVGDPGIHRDPSGLIDTAVEHGVTVLQCVPTLLQALVDDDDVVRCASLRHVFSGGEALSRKLAARFHETLPGVRLVNLYGPTECTINALSHEVTPESLAEEHGSVPIGRPVTDTTLHVLDDTASPVPDGTPGELYLGGVQLARGYLNNPEETATRFVRVPDGLDEPGDRLYRTGDLVERAADGRILFVGRVDNQVKIDGHRIELDEVRLAIQNHGWVKDAAVLVHRNGRTGAQQLVACVALNPREAALMDQGNHGAHHRSKESRLQVRAQLAQAGLRADGPDDDVRPLPHGDDPDQRRRAFARKTYRFFEGERAVRRADVLELLGRTLPHGEPVEPADLELDDVGRVLGNVVAFRGRERLLPKFSYASPGALYATQLYVELAGLVDVPSGLYYHHPVRHQLVRVGAAGGNGSRLRVHFVGRRPAIESVYRNNVREVLQLEAGHMLGVFDETLPESGLAVGPGTDDPGAAAQLIDDEHTHLGSWDLVASGDEPGPAPVDTYLQVHPGGVADLEPGQYHYRDGELHPLATSVVRRNEVIAINQEVYDRAAIGISLVAPQDSGWGGYVELGRRMQRLQMNPFGFGFMSSGYSSETGDPLPSARRIESVRRELGEPTGPSYFFLGGRVSDEQIAAEDMKEDAVHTTGPAEMIKRDVLRFLPRYMVPGRVIVLDGLPYTANGKVDVRALERSDDLAPTDEDRIMVAPRTRTEEQVLAVWARTTRSDDVSVLDDFFAVGGNSLQAVMLIQQLNRRLGTELPLQTLFDEPTVEGIARLIDDGSSGPALRLVALQPHGLGRPRYCWPGLGGYPMNLGELAAALGDDRPFHGVQAEGINPGESPRPTVEEMARHDIEEIRQVQPEGPYTLLGYSFGARVAFEVAHRLEQAGELVDELVLIAPGSPLLRDAPDAAPQVGDPFRDRAFVTILYSVFSGRIDGPERDACVAATRDRASFAEFVARSRPGLDPDTIDRIVEVVRLTYSFRYTFQELVDKRVEAPMSIFRMRGDDYSFVEDAVSVLDRQPLITDLDLDHYGVLVTPGVEQLATAMRAAAAGRPDESTPHEGALS